MTIPLPLMGAILVLAMAYPVIHLRDRDPHPTVANDLAMAWGLTLTVVVLMLAQAVQILFAIAWWNSFPRWPV